MNSFFMRRLVLVGGLFAIAIFAVWYFTSFRYLTVNYKNVSNVVIYKSSTLDSGKENPKPIKEISTNGEKIKLRGGDYTIHYTGKEGYESLYVPVILKEKEQRIDINPSYTEEKLGQLLKEESEAIRQAFYAKYPSAAQQYELQTGKLYHSGKWYGSTLFNKDAESMNADTLRLVMRKSDNRWEIMTNPPDISLSKYSYPDIPEDILRSVNALPSNIKSSRY